MVGQKSVTCKCATAGIIRGVGARQEKGGTAQRRTDAMRHKVGLALDVVARPGSGFQRGSHQTGPMRSSNSRPGISDWIISCRSVVLFGASVAPGVAFGSGDGTSGNTARAAVGGGGKPAAPGAGVASTGGVERLTGVA